VKGLQQPSEFSDVNVIGDASCQLSVYCVTTEQRPPFIWRSTQRNCRSTGHSLVSGHIRPLLPSTSLPLLTTGHWRDIKTPGPGDRRVSARARFDAVFKFELLGSRRRDFPPHCCTGCCCYCSLRMRISLNPRPISPVSNVFRRTLAGAVWKSGSLM